MRLSGRLKGTALGSSSKVELIIKQLQFEMKRIFSRKSRQRRYYEIGCQIVRSKLRLVSSTKEERKELSFRIQRVPCLRKFLERSFGQKLGGEGNKV